MKKARLIVADSENCADMLYATGFNASDPFVYYAVDGREFVVVSQLELARAKSECHSHIKVNDMDDYFSKSDKGRGLKDLVSKVAQVVGVDLWEVPPDFPLIYADALRKLNYNITCVDSLFFPQREIKTEDEINKVIDAMAITELGMKRAIQVLEESEICDNCVVWHKKTLTSEVLRAEIEVELIRNGASPFHTIVASGKQSAEPHNTGSGVILANQPIVIDIFPRVVKNGYWGDMTRTFVKGRASNEVRLAFRAVKEARDNAKAVIKAGITGEQAHKVAFDTLKQHGFETGQKDGVYFGFTHGLGHGVGLEIHEEPRVSPRNKDVLKIGQIITVEPGLYYPEWGGIRLEDIGVVRDDHFQCFNTVATELEIP